MKRTHCVILGLAVVAAMATACAVHVARADTTDYGGPAAPVYGVQLPDGYRQWQLIAPAQEAAPLDELRVVLGNEVAVRAYRDHVHPFPDGTVLVKLAWKHVQSPDFEPASIPGAATTVQVMVKDSRRYAATGGWGYGRFIDGQPVDEAQHHTCHACHASRVQDRDYVFTQLAQ